MQITPEARDIFNEVLADRNMDCIKLAIIHADGRSTIDLQIANCDDGSLITEIDGVMIMADEADLAALDNVIFTEENGKISILQTGGCGGCSGCGDGEGDGCDCGCEGDHEHSHDGDSSCGCGHKHD